MSQLNKNMTGRIFAWKRKYKMLEKLVQLTEQGKSGVF